MYFGDFADFGEGRTNGILTRVKRQISHIDTITHDPNTLSRNGSPMWAQSALLAHRPGAARVGRLEVERRSLAASHVASPDDATSRDPEERVRRVECRKRRE